MNVGSDGKQEIEANIVRIFFIAAIALVICYGFFDTITTITGIEDGQEDQMNKINLDFALFAAGQGYPVVPVDPDNQPYYRSGVLERGWLDATTDDERIR